MDVQYKNEQIGRGYGYSDFGGSSCLWFVIVILFIFAFVFWGRRGHGDNDECGGFKGLAGLAALDFLGNKKKGGCGCEGISNCKVDRDVLIQGDVTREKLSGLIVTQEEKTRQMLERKWEIEQSEKFQRGLANEVEMKGKIFALENKLFEQERYGRLQAHLDRIECNMPKTAPCFIPTASPCLCGCPPQECGRPGRRDCDC